jgi:hypothetical protein
MVWVIADVYSVEIDIDLFMPITTAFMKNALALAPTRSAIWSLVGQANHVSGCRV